MKSVGTTIRTARLGADMSLEEVNVNTRIPVKVLRAIEEDDLPQITSAFFYKSFVRQFCAQVGLAVEDLREPIAEAAATFPEPIIPGQGETLVRNTVIRPLKRPRQARWLFPALSLVSVLVACSGFYAYYESTRAGVNRPAIVRWTGSQNKTPALIAKPSDTVPVEADGKYRVELSAVERTWLSLRADGKQVFSGTLEVDQTKLLEGNQEGQVRTGNAGGVKIVFNGKPIGLAGPHGSVRTVVFTRDNYEVLPNSAHTAVLFSSKVIDGLLRLPPSR